MKLTIKTAILFGVILLLLTACNNQQPKYIIGVSQCSEDVWRDRQNWEMKMETNFHEGVELRFAAALDDSERQIQQIDSLVESGINLLIVAPNQLSSVSPAIDRAYDKGIPVIVFERKTDTQKYTAFVSADNYEMGRLMGEYVVSRLKGKGQVMEILGLKGSSPADERHRGFNDAFANYPDLQVSVTLQGDWTEESAYQAVKDCQGNLDNITLVFGHNDRMAMGARKALTERGGRLPLFTGIDGLPHLYLSHTRGSTAETCFGYPGRETLSEGNLAHLSTCYPRQCQSAGTREQRSAAAGPESRGTSNEGQQLSTSARHSAYHIAPGSDLNSPADLGIGALLALPSQ